MLWQLALNFLVLNVVAQTADVDQMTHVAQAFFDCCETGKGWKGCSQYVTNEDVPFAIEAVDALPGPPVTDSKSVKDYLDWMAGVVQEFGPAASYEVKAKAFDEKTHTALFYGVFMGYSDYVYSITVCPEEGKVSGMTKVWNDQYAFNNIPGSTRHLEASSRKLESASPGVTNLEQARQLSMEFFDCCESGRGWVGCSQLVAADAPFMIEAVDALPGPPVTDNRYVKDYLDWMAGVVQEFGAKASYKVKAHGFDKTTNTALVYAVFMGYSDYVYSIRLCAQEMKVCGLTKVWNDKYAFNNIPGESLLVAGTATLSLNASRHQMTPCIAALLIGLLAVSFAISRRQQGKVRTPESLLG